MMNWVNFDMNLMNLDMNLVNLDMNLVNLVNLDMNLINFNLRKSFNRIRLMNFDLVRSLEEDSHSYHDIVYNLSNILLNYILLFV